MASAEIITIGTELLLGEILDTNSRDIALFLRDHGIDLFRITTVGDNAERISNAIKDALLRTDIIITTGGLGPTVDDPTREAIAAAVDTTTVFLPELWEQIQERFARYGKHATENNRKQAYIPNGAIPIKNDVGTAPAFIVEYKGKTIISLPGVPKELSYLLVKHVSPYLNKKYIHKYIIKARVLHTAGLGESQVDELVADLETQSNPTVGLLAHPGQTDIRITAKAVDKEAAEKMIKSITDLIIERLGNNVYGIDEETMESTFFNLLEKKNFPVCFIEHDLNGELSKRLQPFLKGPQFTSIINQSISDPELEAELQRCMKRTNCTAGLAVKLDQKNDPPKLSVIFITPDIKNKTERTFGGTPELVQDWAIINALDFARRNLI